MQDKQKKVKFITRVDGTVAIERHSSFGRLTHWILGMSFIAAGVSGLAFFHPSVNWFTIVFGSPTWTRILHPFFGVLMALSFIVMMILHVKHNLINKHDLQWLKQIKDVVTGNEHKLPPIGMFNAGQKVLFWSLTFFVFALTITGIIIWRQYFVFTAEVKSVAVLLHAFFAFMMICFIIIHVLAAIMAKGSIGAMLHGTVSYGWARHHHSAWYQEIVDAENAAALHK